MDCRKFALCFSLLSFCRVYACDSTSDTEAASFNIPGGDFRITDEKEISDLTKKVSENLAKIVENDNARSLEFIKIHSATYQVVTGIIYDLKVEMNENKKPTNCTISLWEKPWLDFIKFDVECGDDEKHKYQYLSKEDPDAVDSTSIKAKVNK